MSAYIRKLNKLVSGAWQNQRDQIKQWANGDAIEGASDGFDALKATLKMPEVRRKDWQYMIPNLIVLFVMSLVFLLLHGIILFICYLSEQFFSWPIDPPTLFSTTQFAIWLQIGLWSSLLGNFFYNSAEDCFYSRLKEVDQDGLINVQQCKENWSFMIRAWNSIKRTLKYENLLSTPLEVLYEKICPTEAVLMM